MRKRPGAWRVVDLLFEIALCVFLYAARKAVEMSQALSDLQASVTALEAHAAAVNAERANLAAELAAAKASPPPVAPSDDADLQALQSRVDAVSASIVAPVASLAVPAPVVAPAPVVEPAPAV